MPIVMSPRDNPVPCLPNDPTMTKRESCPVRDSGPAANDGPGTSSSHRVEIEFDMAPATPAGPSQAALSSGAPAGMASPVESTPEMNSGDLCRSSSFFNADWLSGSWTLEQGKQALNDDHNDADSVGSTAYFEPSDFSPSYWMKAMDAPSFGLAVVALATAIAHPLLFVAGALTALGTATAAARGYDFFLDGSWERLFCLANSNEEFKHAALETIGVTSTGKLKRESVAQDESTAENTILGDEEPIDPAYLLVSPSPKHHHQHHQLTSPSTIITLAEADLSRDWLDLYFTPLKNEIVQNQPFVGLNAHEFFRVFFYDHAPFNFQEFQKKRGDLDIQYGLWETLPEVGPLSLLPSAATEFPTGLEYHSFKGRVLSFKAKTNALIGPAYASTTKTQRMIIFSKRLAVLESKTVLSNIPFCDRFFVTERWIIRAEKDQGHYTSHASCACEVVIVQSCPFDHQIRTKSVATLKDVTNAWCAMATKALNFTEQAKLDRMRRENEEMDDEMLMDTSNNERSRAVVMSCDDIEVERRNDRSIVLSDEVALLDDPEKLGRCEPETANRLPYRSTLSKLRRTLSQFSMGRRRSISSHSASPVVT